MGADISSGLTTGLQAASDDELNVELRGIPKDLQLRLATALKNVRVEEDTRPAVTMVRALDSLSDLQQKTIDALLCFLETPEGSWVRAVLMERRKDVNRTWGNGAGWPPADLAERSNLVMPWPFGTPMEEMGLVERRENVKDFVEGVNKMLEGQKIFKDCLPIRLVRRVGNEAGMSSNIYDFAIGNEAKGEMHIALKVPVMEEFKEDGKQKNIANTLADVCGRNANRYFVNTYAHCNCATALELVTGRSVQQTATNRDDEGEDLPLPGTAERIQWAQGVNAQMIDCVRAMNEAGWFHKELKPENMMLEQIADQFVPNFKIIDMKFIVSVGELGQSELLESLPILCGDKAIDAMRMRFLTHTYLSFIAAALYADLHGLLRSGKLKNAETGGRFHWRSEMSIHLINEWLGDNPQWFGEDLALIRRALLLDSPPLDYLDRDPYFDLNSFKDSVYTGGGAVPDSPWLVDFNKMSNEALEKFIDRQEAAFAELVTLGGLEGDQRASNKDGAWCRFV